MARMRMQKNMNVMTAAEVLVCHIEYVVNPLPPFLALS